MRGLALFFYPCAAVVGGSVCILWEKEKEWKNLSGGAFSVLFFIFLPALFLVISDWGLMSSSVHHYFFFFFFAFH